MPRRTDSTPDATSFRTLSRCADCQSPDPQHRTRHQLPLVKTQSLDALRAHLTEQWVTLREPEKQRRDLVDDVCAWVASLIEQYSHMAHPDTGATMAWWEARDYLTGRKDAIALAARQAAPPPPARRPILPEVEGFTRGDPRVATPVLPRTTKHTLEAFLDAWDIEKTTNGQ